MDEKQALSRCAQLCSEREYCLSEIAEKLRKLEIDSEAQQRILDRLVKERYIDEARYASTYARDKARFNKWGPQKIRYMLQQKSVGREAISAGIESVGADVFAEQLSKLIDDKLRSEKETDPWKLRQKLLRLGTSHGFGYEEVLEKVQSSKFNEEGDFEPSSD